MLRFYLGPLPGWNLHWLHSQRSIRTPKFRILAGIKAYRTKTQSYHDQDGT